MSLHTAKLQHDAAGQSVRLPKEFQFDGTEVYVFRDAATGDVVLSQRASAPGWAEFFALMRGIDVPAEFMAERPLNRPTGAAGVFDDVADANHA